MAHSAHTDPEQLIERYETPEEFEKKMDKLAEYVRKSKYTASFTGAGISTSAGIADFRGPTGVWTLQAQGRGHEVKSRNSLTAFPTRTHMGLIALKNANKLKFLISQNCDGLHRKSGFPPDSLAELHGNGNMEECEKCEVRYYRDYKCHRISRGRDHFTGRYCGLCGGRLLEWTIDFGQTLPMDQLHAAEEQSEAANLHICWGSSLTVSPANDMPRTTKENRGKLVIVNLQKTPLDKIADLIIHEKTDKVMEALCKRLDIEIPAWQLFRRVLIDVKQDGVVIVQGMDRYQKLPASLFHGVRLTVAGGEELKPDQEEPITFAVPQQDLGKEADFKLVFQGHYGEPSLTIKQKLDVGTHEFLMDYDPFAKNWTLHEPTVVDSSKLPPIAQGVSAIPPNSFQKHDLPVTPGCWSTISCVTVNRKRAVAIIGGKRHALTVCDGATGAVIKNYPLSGSSDAYLGVARWGHSACTLNENIAKILLFGGWDSQCQYGDLKLLNAADGTVKNVASQGDGPSPRSCHTACIVCLPDPTMFVFGGACCKNGPYEFYNDMYKISLSTFKWEKLEGTGAVPTPRAQHAMAVHSGQYIMVTGGYNGKEVLDDMYIYNIRNNKWTRVAQHLGNSGCGLTHKDNLVVPDFRVPAVRHTAAITRDQHMVLCGAWGVSAMNLGTASWKKNVFKKGEEFPQCTGHSCCAAGDDVWIAGGNTTSGEENKQLYHLTLPRM